MRRAVDETKTELRWIESTDGAVCLTSTACRHGMTALQTDGWKRSMVVRLRAVGVKGQLGEEERSGEERGSKKVQKGQKGAGRKSIQQC